MVDKGFASARDKKPLSLLLTMFNLLYAARGKFTPRGCLLVLINYKPPGYSGYS